jgi:hypothetical protein
MTLFDDSTSQEELEIVDLMTPTTYSWKLQDYHTLFQTKGLRQKSEEEVAAILELRQTEKNDMLLHRRRDRRERNEKLTLEDKAKRLAETKERRLARNATRNPDKDVFLKAKREKDGEERKRRRDEKDADRESKEERRRMVKQQQVMRIKAEQEMRLSSAAQEKIRIDDYLDGPQERVVVVSGSDEL